jgi:hypothetical protein
VNPAIHDTNARAYINVVQLQSEQAVPERRSAAFADHPKGVAKMSPEASVDDGHRPIVEIAHDNRRVTQIVRQKYGVAKHLTALKQSFPARQTEMAIEDMQHGLIRNLDVDAQAESRLAPRMVSQVVFASMHKSERAEDGDPPLSSIAKAGPAKIFVHPEHVGKHAGLIVAVGSRHASVDFLKGNDIRRFGPQNRRNALQFVAVIATDSGMHVVRHQPESFPHDVDT